MNEIHLCDKCKKVNAHYIKEQVLRIDPNIKIKMGCVNMCGVGRMKPFAILNKIPIIAESNEELVELIRKKIKE